MEKQRRYFQTIPPNLYDEIWHLQSLTNESEYFTKNFLKKALIIEAKMRGIATTGLFTYIRYWYYAIVNKTWSPVFLFRLSVYHYHNGIKRWASILHRMNIVLNGCDIGYETRISPPLTIYHPVGIVIGAHTKMGSGCILHAGCQCVQTPLFIGGNGQYPTIGNNVFIGAGTIIVGGVTIGDNSILGAHALVIESIPPYSKVIGPKAKILLNSPRPSNHID
ncbi:serine acetyltransferase [bacterium]|nr:serine acetyltransferase [bacterium]